MKNGNGNGWLLCSEFGQMVGLTGPRINQKIRDGHFKKAELRPLGANGKKVWMVHESEVEGVKNGIKPATKKARKPKGLNVSDENFKDVMLSAVKDFKLERGGIPYKNLSTAVSMALERKDWDDISFETGVRKQKVVTLIEELQAAELDDPGKYKTVMEYLYAGRPYAKANLKMPRKGK